MIDFIRYLLKSILDISGKLLSGIGFFMIIGGLFGNLWWAVGVGIVISILGFLSLRNWE